MCAKCGSPATGALTDPAFELARIETINKILIESGAAFVPLKATDDEGWDAQTASATPATSAPQVATPKVVEAVNVRFARITDREAHDLTMIEYRDHEIL